MCNRARQGDWVQIHSIILPSGARAPQVPEDTQRVPLEMRVKGFAQSVAALGETITIKTVIGREVKGTLRAINPAYDHDFGRPVPELLDVGLELRAMLAKDVGDEND